MAKFFSHFRQKLLANNRTGRYFTYALGEIILVVIGILIALQINNWNESRKKVILKNTYLSRLINDVKKDTSNINYLVKELNINQSSITNLISTLGQENISPELDSALVAFYNRGWVISDFVATANTYTDLSQTGNMNIISNTDLVDEIIRYYGFIKVIEHSNNINKDWITPLDQQLAVVTKSFELDPTTAKLFQHKNRNDALENLLNSKDLLERTAAGHYWINESLSNNVIALKGVCDELLNSLQHELNPSD
ncbi:MAG: hypothetical protein KJO22_10720 [Bacteroidia bacterium]|nr:hypothetical protein [Bacteroidia bacterium]NNF85820.1 hypothetical protein [Winogradskyella sp.]